MERAFNEDELLDSIVIDSEGYIYGKVEKIKVKEAEVSLLVYETRPDERTLANVDAIKQTLLKRVKPTLGQKLLRLSPADILAQIIQKEFGMKPQEPITEDHLIKYAERLGIEIPYKKIIDERKEPKGTVNLREIKAIGISTMAGEEKSTTIKIILLQEPKEAKFRKIPVQNTIPYRGSDTIKDKLVIDARGTALGCVDSLVLFRNTPGIRIYALKPSDSISLTFLSRYLEKIGRPDIKDELAKYFQSDTGYHVYKAKMSDVEEFMRKTNLSFRVPEEVLVDHGVREFVMDIPWDIVQKIGDVVLLKETLSDIRSKGF